MEKSILIAIYILSGQSTRKYVDMETMLKKFPIRQRKMVRRYIDELKRKGLILRHKTKDSYRLNKRGVKEIARVFLEGGARIRI